LNRKWWQFYFDGLWNTFVLSLILAIWIRFRTYNRDLLLKRDKLFSRAIRKYGISEEHQYGSHLSFLRSFSGKLFSPESHHDIHLQVPPKLPGIKVIISNSRFNSPTSYFTNFRNPWISGNIIGYFISFLYFFISFDPPLFHRPCIYFSFYLSINFIPSPKILFVITWYIDIPIVHLNLISLYPFLLLFLTYFALDFWALSFSA